MGVAQYPAVAIPCGATMFWQSDSPKNPRLSAFYEVPAARARTGMYVLYTSEYNGTEMYAATVDGATVSSNRAVTYGVRPPKALRDGIPLAEARIFKAVPQVYTDDKNRQWTRDPNGDAVLWRPAGGRGLQLFTGEVHDGVFYATTAVNFGERVPRRLYDDGTPLADAIRYSRAGPSRAGGFSDRAA